MIETTHFEQKGLYFTSGIQSPALWAGLYVIMTILIPTKKFLLIDSTSLEKPQGFPPPLTLRIATTVPPYEDFIGIVSGLIL